MPTEAKMHEVDEFSDLLSRAQSIVLADFTGLNVAAVSQLRRRCRAAGVEYKVVKNTLARRAVERAGIPDLSALLEGPSAWAVHPGDQVVAAKVLVDFAKEHEVFKIRGGFVEGRVLTHKELVALAKLPGRDVLLAQVLGTLQAPMAGFAGALSAVLRGFATVVQAYAKKRGETADA
jgi:large subunit ribosomal protein L10